MNSSCSLKLLPFTEKCITTHQNYFSYIRSISNWHPSNISSPRHKKSSAKLCGKRLNRSRQRNKSICVHVHGSTPHHLHYALAEQYPIWNWYNTATAAAGFAVLCCGSESTEQSKISTVCCYWQMSSLYNLWKTVLFVHNTVCGCQTGFSTVSASKVLCVYWKWMLLVLGVKKVQIRYKKSKKEKAVILDTVCKNVKNVYCKHCSLSHIHPSCRSCLDAWYSFCALLCVQCSMFSQCLIY